MVFNVFETKVPHSYIEYSILLEGIMLFSKVELESLGKCLFSTILQTVSD